MNTHYGTGHLANTRQSVDDKDAHLAHDRPLSERAFWLIFNCFITLLFPLLLLSANERKLLGKSEGRFSMMFFHTALHYVFVLLPLLYFFDG